LLTAIKISCKHSFLNLEAVHEKEVWYKDVKWGREGVKNLPK
jgi:hypothetical protein